ncbi:cobalamin-dependent protein, partial [Oscillochloris sp. ZM17-4]|uniref:B12-binding domain-containing radical SAM protein n=1 Tax=Oscillochloris sp. ZM17-4 TaxID=2866714 RepID=UPI001C72D4C2
MAFYCIKSAICNLQSEILSMRAMFHALLAQLPVPSSPALNTPLAAGYLKAYAEAHGLGARADIQILPRAIADHAGDAALAAAIIERAPDLLGLSLYTWNSERSLELARRVRAQLPGMIVVVGGPEVQADNAWVLGHPAVDVAVIGEGEQTFAELLLQIADCRLQIGPNLQSAICNLQSIPGLALRGPGGEPIFTGERVALGDLAAIPSPYLAGHLELPPDGMQMVEVSRWCPYACSFCLYGRNMGPRLGGRSFSLERVLAEIAWGKARGVRRVHFVEANLNLLPIFWPLMRALAELNADRQIAFYAELRGEHLSAEAVAALDAANIRVVEVGLQTANPAALRASYRKTDLAKWAAGTRRLYAAKIEVLLDVILGLPEDDADGVAETLAFIEREGLGPYDIFTLQVLPGTALRREAARHGLTFQGRPPYYVLGTSRLSYAELRRLRRELKLGAGLDPDEVEGVPAPRADALADGQPSTGYVSRITPRDIQVSEYRLSAIGYRLSSHVDLILPADQLAQMTPLLAGWMQANPSTVFDIYLEVAGEPPRPEVLRAWRDGLPYTPGYLDRVAAYANETPEPGHARAGLRIWLALPWVSQAEPGDYAGVAGVIWRYELGEGEALPLGAWRTAGGAGIALAGAGAGAIAAAREWAAAHGRVIW